MERLQATQRTYEIQLVQLDQKLQGLAEPDRPCPLCDRPLDDLHWQLVRNRHKQEREAIQQDIWAIREQLAVSEREIQVLRQEYRDLEVELADYSTVLEQRGQLQAQLAASDTLQPAARGLGRRAPAARPVSSPRSLWGGAAAILGGGHRPTGGLSLRRARPRPGPGAGRSPAVGRYQAG
jgi:hypothetical protein